MRRDWPELDYPAWAQTATALHLFLQVAGKYRLAHTPWQNHSWHATFYVGGWGLSSSLIPDRPGIEIVFDLLEHCVRGRNADGRSGAVQLRPMSVATFHAEFKALIEDLGGTPAFDNRPNEMRGDTMPFERDEASRPYQAEAVTRFYRALVSIDTVFRSFRTGFVGKSSPVHLFWGSFDLAVTRFSGRRAPLHPGGVPGLPDAVAREAYDREVSSAGFWPGGGGIEAPTFYAYAYPAPAGFSGAAVAPAAARWNDTLGEFILPYEAVRTSADPASTLLQFLQTTYEAAATLGSWDRALLECAPGRRRVPRPASPK